MRNLNRLIAIILTIALLTGQTLPLSAAEKEPAKQTPASNIGSITEHRPEVVATTAEGFPTVPETRISGWTWVLVALVVAGGAGGAVAASSGGGGSSSTVAAPTNGNVKVNW
jgi:hypothetical protein